jgi:hypothetical protein
MAEGILSMVRNAVIKNVKVEDERINAEDERIQQNIEFLEKVCEQTNQGVNWQTYITCDDKGKRTKQAELYIETYNGSVVKHQVTIKKYGYDTAGNMVSIDTRIAKLT